MDSVSTIRLTSAEIAHLWVSYMHDTLGVCVMKYFYKIVEDPEIKPLIEYSLHLSEKHVKSIADYFGQEDIPVPVGFTDADVDLSAPRLFSDSFMLHYTHQMGQIGLLQYTLALHTAAREDVHDFFAECIASSRELFTKSLRLLLAKGIYVRPPYIDMQKQVDFVEKRSFLSGFKTDVRPLNAMEITHVFTNIQANILGKALMMGFSQVARNKDVRQFIVRGKEIAKKQIEVFSSALRKEDIPTPMTWDGDVMASQVPPFSDKLMMFHTTAVIASGIGNYGIALSQSARSDISATYIRLITEIMQYASDGAKIMIDQGWFEEPPQAPDREALAQQN